jgi:hypothetical protein
LDGRDNVRVLRPRFREYGEFVADEVACSVNHPHAWPDGGPTAAGGPTVHESD